MMNNPLICFAGPMLGRHAGWVPNPSEILAPYLELKGYKCLLTSSLLNRYLRFFDIVRTVILYRKRIDTLCIQVYGGPSFVVEDIVSWLGARFSIPIIMVLRGGDLPKFMYHHRKWIKKVFLRANTLITPTAFLAKSLEVHGFRSLIIPNSIELENYKFHQRSNLRPRLLWMRTFHEVYNPLMAIRVFAKLKQLFPDATLTMAGQDKGLLEELKEEVQKMGFSAHIHFPGFLKAADKQREFANHDIFLNTNKIDNTPVSLIEAAAFGMPIVATNIGGISYLFSHEENALLVQDDNVQEMLASIVRLLQESELAERLSVNARRLAEKCDLAQVVSLWELALMDAMKNR